MAWVSDGRITKRRVQLLYHWVYRESGQITNFGESETLSATLILTTFLAFNHHGYIHHGTGIQQHLHRLGTVPC
ncbi:MAG: hypothetical protein IGR76_15130 [Synechococcales cyanobacterium T60_A2020_003]|nr:hypothetical protein [Synechococcales cyanobacterium T60_A2020_003]